MKNNVSYPHHDKKLSDLPNEEWKEIPGLDGNYLISNFGRVKSLPRLVERPPKDFWTKEKVLSLNVHVQKLINGDQVKLLRLVITYKRKKITILVSRMVYYLFVHEFDLKDSKLVVVPKNFDNLNVSFENLDLINKSDMLFRTYGNGRNREAFSNKPKKITQYERAGNKIKVYDSMNMIEKETDFDAGIISDVVKRENNEYQGYIWKCEEDL